MSDDLLDALDSVKYLYLRELSEPRDNSLRIVVDEATEDRPPTDGIVSAYRAIEPTDACRSFELFWKTYVAYLVTEECVGWRGAYEDEIFTGKILRRYSQSHFLAHVGKDTGAHTAPIQHRKLICLNHLIDVASYDPPEIRLVARTSRSAQQVSRTPNLAKS